MGEFPSFKQRLLDCGVPQEIVADITGEVSSTRQAFGFMGTLAFVRFLSVLALAAVLIPVVYLAAFWNWGTLRPCGAGFLTSAHFVAFLQLGAIQIGTALLQYLMLQGASHKTQMHYISARLMQAYLSGGGVGLMNWLIKKNPECATPTGLYRHLLNDWRMFKFSLCIWPVVQLSVPAALFLIPLTC
ncbi:hypothetical protein ACQKH5_13965 [Hyphomonas sp. NPDC076900]|uniref:hypothetical protein n=1 Tax=unclassified Hyphomonas TaxID=2630699 RepID=UPI003D0406AF